MDQGIEGLNWDRIWGSAPGGGIVSGRFRGELAPGGNASATVEHFEGSNMFIFVWLLTVARSCGARCFASDAAVQSALSLD